MAMDRLNFNLSSSQETIGLKPQFIIKAIKNINKTVCILKTKSIKSKPKNA
jgi:hypothetical protein